MQLPRDLKHQKPYMQAENTIRRSKKLKYSKSGTSTFQSFMRVFASPWRYWFRSPFSFPRKYSDMRKEALKCLQLIGQLLWSHHWQLQHSSVVSQNLTLPLHVLLQYTYFEFWKKKHFFFLHVITFLEISSSQGVEPVLIPVRFGFSSFAFCSGSIPVQWWIEIPVWWLVPPSTNRLEPVL